MSQAIQTLKRTGMMALYVLLSLAGLIAVFFAGQIKGEFKVNTVDVSRVCNYCTGERWPQSLEIGRSELRLTCGKGELERISVLARNRND